MNKLENDILTKRIDSLKIELEKAGIFKDRNIGLDMQSSFAFVVYTAQRYSKNPVLEEIIESITEGSGDHDFDILHIDEDGSVVNVSIFQCKYRTEAKLNATIGEKDVDSFLNKIKKILIENDQNITIENIYLKNQLKKFFEITKSSTINNIKINICLATNSSNINDAQIKTLDRFKSENSNIESWTCFHDYDFFIDDSNESIGEIIIPISSDAISMNEEINAKIVNIKAFHLAELYERFQDKILEKNVRKLLKGKINRTIQESMISNPKLFWYKNNGLSIVCKRMEVKTLLGQKNIILENPYIVNGGQTTKTIFNLFKNRNKENEADMEPFYNTSVMARIYQTTDEAIISEIVYGTNNQNKITASDLKSLNPNIAKIKSFFAEHKINLITKRDSEQLVRGSAISTELLLQIYLSIFHNIPHLAKHSKTRVVEEYYDKIFESNENHHKLIIAYKFHQCVSKLLAKRHEDDIKRLSLFSLMFAISKIDKEITESFDETKVSTAYIKGVAIIQNLLDEQRNTDNNFSSHNYFKSKALTQDILNRIGAIS